MVLPSGSKCLVALESVTRDSGEGRGFNPAATQDHPLTPGPSPPKGRGGS